jgi:hypothetical protein
MRISIYAIVALLSLAIWFTSFTVARESYRFAHVNGFIPNLHIAERIDRLL